MLWLSLLSYTQENAFQTDSVFFYEIIPTPAMSLKIDILEFNGTLPAGRIGSFVTWRLAGVFLSITSSFCLLGIWGRRVVSSGTFTLFVSVDIPLTLR